MRIQPYNQHSNEELLRKITGLQEDKYLNSATIRAVFTKSMDRNWEYYIGKCEIGVAHEDIEVIYTDHAFICKSLSDFDLKIFLESLEKGGCSISNKMPSILMSGTTKLNWSEDLIPGHSTSTGYPVRKYHEQINSNAYFNESFLLGFDMTFHSSSGDYLKDFMGMRQFHGSSDARKGEISIEIADQRGKICVGNGQVSIDGKEDDICLVGQTPLLSSLILKTGATIDIDERNLNEAELWLVTKENEILDFRSKIEWQYRLENLDNENERNKQYLAIIDQGENQEVEFKTYIDLSKNKNSKAMEVEKTVCAFSNAHGGTMFIGITDDGCIEGIDNKVKEHYSMKIEDAVEAYMRDLGARLREILKDNQCFDISLAMLGTKHIVVILVIRSDTPNFCITTRNGYIRKGASSFKMASTDEREQVNQSNPFSLDG